METQMTELQEQVAEIQEALREKDAQILQLNTALRETVAENKALSERVKKLEDLQGVKTNAAKLEDLQEVQSLTLNEVSAFRKSGNWKSQEFYSHDKGYKLQLDASVSSGAGKMSVSIDIKSGEYDDHLKWPMRAQVTLQLVDVAHGRQLYEKVLTGSRQYRGPGPLCGWCKLDADLDDFIHEDSLHFRVKVVTSP